MWQGPKGTPHSDDRPPAEEGLEVWTGVDFSVCVVAPPGERSVGAGRGEAARRGVEVSVEGLGRLFAREQMAPRASVAYVAARTWSPDGLYRGGWGVPLTGEATGGLGMAREPGRKFFMLNASCINHERHGMIETGEHD